MRFGIRASALTGLIFLAACSTTPKYDASWPEDKAASAARIEQDLSTLASDAYEGREAGTPGYDMAVEYVTAQFKEMGLKPGGEGKSYLQQVPLRRAYTVADGASLTVGDTEMVLYQDFIVDSARQSEDATATGEIVYMGYGIDAPSFGLTAYDDVDVKGKIVAVIPGTPGGLPSEESAHFSSFSTKRLTAAEHGAAGMIVLINTRITEASRAQATQQMGRATNMVAHPQGSRADLDAMAYVTRDGVEKLLDGTGVEVGDLFTGEMEAKGLGVTATLTTKTRFEDYQSPNVVAILPGTDLKDEYVILTAHLDHIGVLNSVEEGKDLINNGAMDNGSGTSTMLEAARKFVSEGKRPRRSIVFVSLTAEEKGLLGSEWFAANPTVPHDGMVANVNLDMPILLHDFTDVIAFGAEHSTLKGLVETAANDMGVTLTPDPVPHMVLFVRSDHYNFVKQGVPSVFLFLGFANGGEEAFQGFMANNYHRPSDQPDLPIMYDVAAKFAELNYRIAKEIANAGDVPSWNEGDFFGDLFGR